MRKKAILVSAFPGCGKSTFYNKYSTYSDTQNEEYKEASNCKILDSDSSEFSWIWKDGVKTEERNPEFPQNYIEHIESEMLHQDIIFISTHQNVRQGLQEKGFSYYLVYPDRSMKEEWIKRYRERGSSEAFIQSLDENWDTYMDQMEAEQTNKIVLDKETDNLEDALLKIWKPKTSMVVTKE